MILYPAIDLIDGRAVRLLHGRFDQVIESDLDDALVHAHEALALRPSSAPVLNTLGAICLRRGDDLAHAPLFWEELRKNQEGGAWQPHQRGIYDGDWLAGARSECQASKNAPTTNKQSAMLKFGHTHSP